MNIENLKNMLYNAIICWYDDALEEYSGLDDENAMQNDNEKLKERNQGRYVAMFDLLHRLEIYEK